MEKDYLFNSLRRPLGVVMALGSVSLVAGCSAGSHEILAHNDVIVMSEYETEHFVSAVETGGYSHFESVYRFIVRQCDRSGEEIADEDGCVELNIIVDEQTYDSFSTGDRVVFDTNIKGYLVEDK